ncbi:hypothetical protein [Microvirga massiliensis]|uniref:hypothetical protein n=1 Tax=Microvirga massiliensis TaxID=1033741 RepID=UPI00062BDD59|nr:hypothetical protein [Microvirga massiliensis]
MSDNPSLDFITALDPDFFAEADTRIREHFAERERQASNHATANRLPGQIVASAKVLATRIADLPQAVADHVAAMQVDRRGADVIRRGFGSWRSEINGIVTRAVLYGDGRQAETFVMTVDEAVMDEVEGWFDVEL